MRSVRYCLLVPGTNILIEMVATLLALGRNGGRMDERIRKTDSEMPGGGRDDTGGTGRACGNQLELSWGD